MELAPDDLELFAEGAQDLEVRGEIELDLDEFSGEPPPWAETEESEAEGEQADRTRHRERPRSPEIGSRFSRSRDTSLRMDTSANSSVQQRGARDPSVRQAETSGSYDSAKLSRILSPPRAPPEPPLLPELPQPDLSQSVDDDEVGALSSGQPPGLRPNYPNLRR